MRKSSPARPYIEASTTIRVRFQEVDSMRIVWHGHYLSYFEDARRAFGQRYGLDYADIRRHDVQAPLIHVGVDFLAPALDNDLLEVTARLLKSDAAKLEFQYLVRRAADGKLLARGESTQAFTKTDGTLLLSTPGLLVDCYRQWERAWK
jgi:acyl-CoA thioester hydrolase